MRNTWNNLSLMHKRGYAYASLAAMLIIVIVLGFAVCMDASSSIDWPKTITFMEIFAGLMFAVTKLIHWLECTKDMAKATGPGTYTISSDAYSNTTVVSQDSHNPRTTTTPAIIASTVTAGPEGAIITDIGTGRATTIKVPADYV